MVGQELDELERMAGRWEPVADGEELARGFAVVDELVAKLTAAAGRFDAAAGWELDGATSMRAWLRDRAGMSERLAAATVKLGRRCRAWPAVSAAWREGKLSGGQVEVISANVADPAAVELFADHEEALVPVLVPLSVGDTTIVMRDWAAKAEATSDRDDGRPPRRSRLHSSTTLDGRRRLDGDLSVEDGEVVATALRLAGSPDVEGEPRRMPAEQRAGALVDVCRGYLDHRPGGHAGEPGHGGEHGDGGVEAIEAVAAKVRGRQRPHLNVVCDLDALADPRGHVRLLDGTPLDVATSQRLLCDADVHRVLMKGRGVVLEYGAASRVVANGLFQALVIRDRGCRFPGCDRPPEWTEAHHVVPWSRGGPTDIGNLVLLCARHHHLVHGQHGHRPGWHLHLTPDGTVEATSPVGAVTKSRPPP